jgi:hypothetical protein
LAFAVVAVSMLMAVVAVTGHFLLNSRQSRSPAAKVPVTPSVAPAPESPASPAGRQAASGPADESAGALGDEIRVLFDAGTPQHLEWGLDPRKGRLSVTSIGPSCLALGRIESLPCSVELDITPLNWTGLRGLLLGYRSEQRLGQECAVFQFLSLERVEPPGQPAFLRLRRSRAILDPSSASLISEGGIAWDLDVSRGQTLSVGLGEDGARWIRLDNRECPQRIVRAGNRLFHANDYLGVYGVYNENGTTWFDRPQ